MNAETLLPTLATVALGITDAVLYADICATGHESFPEPHGRVGAYRVAANAITGALSALESIPDHRDYSELREARLLLRTCQTVLPDAPEPWRAEEPHYSELIETAARFRRKRTEDLAGAFDRVSMLMDDLWAAAQVAPSAPISKTDLVTLVCEKVECARNTAAGRINAATRKGDLVEVEPGFYFPESVARFMKSQRPKREYEKQGEPEQEQEPNLDYL